MSDNFSLLDNLAGRDEFLYLVSCIDKNSLYPFSLTFKAAHEAVVNLNEPTLTTWESVSQSIPLIEWATDNGCPVETCIWLAEAGKNGNLELVRWLCEKTLNGSGWDYAAKNVALYGHLHVLEWAYEDKNISISSSIYANAAKGGHIKVLEWAREKGIGASDFSDQNDVTEYAALGGQCETLDWLRKNGFDWDTTTCAGAAAGGHLELLKWLRDEGCPWDSTVYSKAAFKGHLDIIKWAHSQSLPHDNCEICGLAAEKGNFEMLQWARENGFSWGRYTMWWAARANNLEILKWAHENGCMCSITRSNRLRCSMTCPDISWELIEWVEQNLGRY